jgi:hypothetical protein
MSDDFIELGNSSLVFEGEELLDIDSGGILNITEQYTMQGGGVPAGQVSWGEEDVPPQNTSKMKTSGCAITLMANIAYSEGLTNITPRAIRENSTYFNDKGLKWSDVADTLELDLHEREDLQLTVAHFNELSNDTTEYYYVGIRVNYTGDPSDSHWVGAVEVREGNQFYRISRTSDNDNVLGTSPTNNRSGMGWEVENGIIFVPVNRVTGYVIFKKR